MRPEDAEEYTQALGQVVAGSWRQVALGKRLGVPQALGLTTEVWVEKRLGGYVRLSIPERREAVKELTAPVEDGGAGMSTREAAEVLGVDNVTVWHDQQAVEKSTQTTANPAPLMDVPVENSTAAPPAQNSPTVTLIPDIEQAPMEPEEEKLLTPGMDLSNIPSGKPPIEYKALSAIGKLTRFRQLHPQEVAAECPPNAVEIQIDELECIRDFIDAVREALQSRLERPALALVGGDRRST